MTRPSGSKVSYYYDADSGLKIRKSETMQSPQGEIVQDQDFSDYREVDGIKFPFSTTIPMGGPMKLTANTENLELNTGINDSEFALE